MSSLFYCKINIWCNATILDHPKIPGSWDGASRNFPNIYIYFLKLFFFWRFLYYFRCNIFVSKDNMYFLCLRVLDGITTFISHFLLIYYNKKYILTICLYVICTIKFFECHCCFYNCFSLSFSVFFCVKSRWTFSQKTNVYQSELCSINIMLQINVSMKNSVAILFTGFLNAFG